MGREEHTNIRERVIHFVNGLSEGEGNADGWCRGKWRGTLSSRERGGRGSWRGEGSKTEG